MKKVLYISHSADLNGAEISLLTLVKSLNKNRFTPIVAVPRPGPLIERLSEIGVKTVVTPLIYWIQNVRDIDHRATPNFMDRCAQIVEIIKKESIDIVHTNTSVVAEGAVAAKITGKPHIWHLHEFIEGHPSLRPLIPRHLVYTFINLFSDAVITVSNSLKQAVEGAIAPERIHVVYNGIIPPEEDGCDSDFRKKLNIANDDVLVTSVGSVIKEKGRDTLVDSAAIVLEQNVGVYFVSVGGVGDIDLWAEIQEKLKSLQQKDHVVFLDFRTDLWSILQASDICLVSSTVETFSLATIEAMALCKPVVATCCGGPEEIVQDGDTGFLVPVGDADAMANSILRLIKSPHIREEMGRKGRERFETHFTSSAFARKVETIYDELHGRRLLGIEGNNMANALLELVTNMFATIQESTPNPPLSFANIFLPLRQYKEAWSAFGFIHANKKAFQVVISKIRKES